MEVVGAAAALVKAVRKVRSWITHATHLADHIRELHSELESLEILTHGLRRAVEGGALSTEGLHDQTAKTISEAETTIARLRGVILKARHGNSLDVPRLLFSLRESQCNDFRRKIQGHTGILTGIMLVVIHDVR